MHWVIPDAFAAAGGVMRGVLRVLLGWSPAAGGAS
jgi:hypothetical protein